MRRALLTLTLLLGSGAQAVRVTAPAGGQVISAAQPVTLAFEVHNDTAVAWSGSPQLDLPPGWGVLFPPDPLTLQPGERQVLLVPVTAPFAAAAGDYAVTVQADEVRAATMLRVAQQREVKVQAVSGDGVVLDGRVNAAFLVSNTGNVSEVLEVSAEPSGLTISPARLTLGPGAQATLTVTGTLAAARGGTHRVALKVQGQGGLTRTAARTHVTLIGELPVAERALTLHGQMRFSVGTTPHADVALSGRVHPDVPGTVDVFASNEAWRVRYQDEGFTVAAGHLTHGGLLLQPGTRLVGVSAGVRAGPWQADVSAGVDQGTFVGGGTLSFVGTYGAGRLGLVTSALGTTLAADISGRAGKFTGWASGALDSESDAARGAFGVSYQDRLTGASLVVSYRDPGFLGESGGDLTVRADARRQIRKDLTASVSATYQSDLAAASPAKVAVAGRLGGRAESLDVSLKTVGGRADEAGLRYQNGAWDTRLTLTPGVVAVHTRTAVAVGPVLVRPAVGAQMNLQSGAVTPSLGLGADWAVWNGSASVGLLSPSSVGASWILSGGVNVKVQKADLAVSGTVNVGGALPSSQLRAVLSYPLEIVTGRRRDVGRIEGQLQMPGGQPLAGLRLRAGPLMATTDASGRFVFPDVPQGPVQLDLVDRDAAVGLRARPAMPLTVSVRGGLTSVVNVSLSPGATVQGRLVLNWPQPSLVQDRVLVPAPPVVTALVLRLRGPDTSYEATPAEDGRFELTGVPPGEYDVLLSVGGRTLLTTARLVTPTLTVPDGGTVEATLMVVPVTQDVQIEDGGTLELK